jgi:Domain of unknown function (DUF1844)
VSALADEHEDQEDHEGHEAHEDHEDHEGHEDHEEEAADEEVDAMLDEMLKTIQEAQVAPLILSTVSTFTSVAFGKLEAKDLAEAKIAIDAIGALLPVLKGEIDETILRDFDQALTNLRLSYADAVASAE